MSDTDLPPGHIRRDGRHFVALEIFEAANHHVLEQGIYCNQLIGTINEIGAVNRKLEAERLQLMRDLHAARAELNDRDRTISAMRTAVYSASEGL